jgi:hypothetical protein
MRDKGLTAALQTGVWGLLIALPACTTTTRPLPNTPAMPAAVAPANPTPAATAVGGKPAVTNANRAAAVKPKNGGKAPSSASAKPPPAAATLDLTSLQQRLRDTRAIGVLTKLSLKNQVDDLLDQLRAYHHGDRTASLADLQQRYNQLLLKVLGLLQNSDAPLAAAISSSRDAIWGILSDPDKFAKI